MLLHGQQQLAEIAEQLRPDRLAFQGTGETEHREFIDRDREMIAPEIHQPLDPRPLGSYRIAQSCLHFSDVDRPKQLRQAHHERQRLARCWRRGRSRCRIPPLGLQLLSNVCGIPEDIGRGTQAGDRQ